MSTMARMVAVGLATLDSGSAPESSVRPLASASFPIHPQNKRQHQRCSTRWAHYGAATGLRGEGEVLVTDRVTLSQLPSCDV